jgi:Cys-tRNA(Pro)/Cys-tRNA(Cys) deacylase
MKTKTNAMRLLDRANIPYEVAEYEVDESDLSGVHLAETLGIDVERVFKTLVTRGDKNGLHVFVIPAAEELDLKKCAAVTGDKRIEMIAVKELLPLTGYIRGGCSPVGMKKLYPTHIDELATLYDTVYVSGGQRGLQLILNPVVLADYVGAVFADVTK